MSSPIRVGKKKKETWANSAWQTKLRRHERGEKEKRAFLLILPAEEKGGGPPCASATPAKHPEGDMTGKKKRGEGRAHHHLVDWGGKKRKKIHRIVVEPVRHSGVGKKENIR